MRFGIDVVGVYQGGENHPQKHLTGQIRPNRAKRATDGEPGGRRLYSLICLTRLRIGEGLLQPHTGWQPGVVAVERERQLGYTPLYGHYRSVYGMRCADRRSPRVRIHQVLLECRIVLTDSPYAGGRV